jgi:hypothetical protein
MIWIACGMIKPVFQGVCTEKRGIPQTSLWGLFGHFATSSRCSVCVQDVIQYLQSDLDRTLFQSYDLKKNLRDLWLSRRAFQRASLGLRNDVIYSIMRESRIHTQPGALLDAAAYAEVIGLWWGKKKVQPRESKIWLSTTRITIRWSVFGQNFGEKCDLECVLLLIRNKQSNFN